MSKMKQSEALARALQYYHQHINNEQAEKFNLFLSVPDFIFQVYPIDHHARAQNNLKELADNFTTLKDTLRNHTSDGSDRQFIKANRQWNEKCACIQKTWELFTRHFQSFMLMANRPGEGYNANTYNLYARVYNTAQIILKNIHEAADLLPSMFQQARTIENMRDELQAKVQMVVDEYTNKPNRGYWSRHGSDGKKAATAFGEKALKCRTLAQLTTLVNDHIRGRSFGNYNPHSFKSMLITKLNNDVFSSDIKCDTIPTTKVRNANKNRKAFLEHMQQWLDLNNERQKVEYHNPGTTSVAA